MIIVTGAAGFIGSCFISKLNREGFEDIIAVDDFSNPVKNRNLINKKITSRVDRMQFFDWLKKNHQLTQFIIHLGARTDTTEFNTSVFEELNLGYSKKVWQACVDYNLPLLYASSAATYGSGNLGYDDDHAIIPSLEPLNPYGVSKNEFDKWVLEQKSKPFFWAGFKFFNVYGPNEYHKGRMASVVMHAFHQIKQTGSVKLFRSHKPDFEDGEQKRDFIYVMDVCQVLFHFMTNRNTSNNGIYNLGTGIAESFNTLAKSLFRALNLNESINYIDTPLDIRDKYQYFTEAKMEKLRKAGYSKSFLGFSEGISDYVTHYLVKDGYC